MPKTSIIILTYNSEKYIEELIGSLERFSDYQEIIVVDNNSDDTTVNKIKKLRRNLPIKIIENVENVGFAKGINKGAEHAKGEHLLFINPDAKFEKGSPTQLVDVILQYESVGIVGGKIIKSDGLIEKSAGKFFGILSTISIALGMDEKLGVRVSPDNVRKVDFVSGGFMLVSAELFERLGGFDENFFMYVEDMDLCFRAKRLGYSTYFTPAAVIRHAGQGSSSRSFAIRNIVRGILRFHKKHGTPFSYFCVKTIFLV